MSRRFITLLDRATRIRRLIEQEQMRPTPSLLRLMRMKQLYLHVSGALKEMTAKRLVGMASAPRFRPQLAFSAARPSFAGRW